jgi:YD repeat-containing protein
MAPYKLTELKELAHVRQLLFAFAYNDLGRRTSLTRGNGTVTGYGYDPVSRLASLTQDLAGGAQDLGLTFSYNPASQIASNTRSNDAYAWTGHGSGTMGSTTNGLNQLVNQGGAALSHDARGNSTFDGARSFGYTAENRLVNGPGTNQYHDALGRLFHLSGSGVNLHHDGSAMIEETLPGGHVRRFVHGPGVDEPLVWYEGAGTGDKRYLHADERGSIVSRPSRWRSRRRPAPAEPQPRGRAWLRRDGRARARRAL